MIWIEAISSSNRKRVTSTSWTSESRTIIALSKYGGTAGLRCTQCSTSGTAQFTTVEQRLQLRVLVVEAAHEADLDQPLAELGFALDDLQRGRDVGGQRLLAHHRLAVLEAGQQLLLVGRARGGEHDGVDVRVGDRVERIGDGAAAGDGRGELLGLLGDVVVDDGDPGAGDLAWSMRATWSAPITPTPRTATRKSDMASGSSLS